jgi:hypothetical protein
VIYTPTTPILSSITVSYDPDACPAASTACGQMDYSRSQCLLTGHTSDTTAFSSCLCNPAILSLEYTCSVLGNVSCLQVPAHLDSMTGYSYCNNINDVLTIPESLVGFLHRNLLKITSRQSTDLCPQTASLGPGTTNRATYFTPPTTTATQAGTTFPAGAGETSPAASNSASSMAIDLIQKSGRLRFLVSVCLPLLLAI